MTNDLLALLIIAAGIIGCSAKSGRGLTIAMLTIVSVILLGVSGSSASHGSYGPLIAVVAFVGTFGLITLFRRRK